MISEEILPLLKKGDVVNLSIGKFGKIWKVLESGNVYGKDAGFFEIVYCISIA